MSHEAIAIFMFASMLLMLLTGQRVFAAIGFVSAAVALMLYGNGAIEMPFNAAFKLFNWYPLLTLPLFVYMGYILSESGIADDLYKMFHVWCGGLKGGLAVGTIALMIVISAMNGLSVAGMAIGATIALPEMLRRGYDKIMITGVVQAGSSLGILVPPSVVLVLYGMIARQPVGKLWLAGVFPGLMMAAMFVIYIVVRCRLQPHLGPALDKKGRDMPLPEKLRLLKAGIIPFLIFFFMTGLFVMGITSLVESSAVGATAATLAAAAQAAVESIRTGRNRQKDSGCFLHVHVDYPGGAVFRSRIRRHWRGSGDRVAVHYQMEPFALGSADHDAVVLPPDGDVSGRHGDAGDRRPALCASDHHPRFRPHLVWGALYYHLPDRLYDTAFRLQSFPDAGHGPQGDIAFRHLPVDHSVCTGHDTCVNIGHPVSTNSLVVAGAGVPERLVVTLYRRIERHH